MEKSLRHRIMYYNCKKYDIQDLQFICVIITQDTLSNIYNDLFQMQKEPIFVHNHPICVY